jgi:microcystin-dependent protein
MPTDPATVIPAIGVAQGTNGDLPAQDMPALSRIAPTDSVGPSAANRQHQALEKRTLSLLDRVNKLIDTHNVLDAWFLRADGTAQDGGSFTGMQGNLAMNTFRLTGVGNPVNAQDAATLAVANAICPVGSFLPWSAPTAPVGIPGLITWMICDKSSLLIASYPELYDGAWGSTPLYGQIDGSHFYLPDGRGRTFIGAGAATGGVGADNTPIGTVQTLGALLGQEKHSMSLAENGPHAHSYVYPGNTIMVGAGLGTAALVQSNSTATTTSGSGTAHQNIQPSTVIGGWIIRVK